MSETTRNMRRWEECRVAAEGAAPAPREQAGRAASVAFVCGLRGEKPTRTAAGLSREELLAVVEGDEASRAVQIALVSRLDDAELLIDIALSAVRIPPAATPSSALTPCKTPVPRSSDRCSRIVRPSPRPRISPTRRV